VPVASEVRSDERLDPRRARSQAAIVDAAIALFQEQGVQATSVEAICERAGVSIRTFFNHFETRQHLHDRIADQRARQAADVLRAYAEDERPLTDRLAEFLATMAAYLADRPAYRDFVGEMLQRHPARGFEAVRGGELFDGVRTLVASAVDRGELGADQQVDALADVIVGATVLLTANWSASERFDVRAGARETAAVLRPLLGPPA
jgi:AcrR family transcriptional regulator